MLHLCAFSNIAFGAERAEVFENGPAPARNGCDVIDVQLAANLRRGAGITNHAPKAVTTEHVVPKAKTDIAVA